MSQALQPGSRISHYLILGPLGSGGMGEVYRAKDESLGRDVALKILPPEAVRSEERVRRFILEAKSASSLSHPNIVTIHEIGHDLVRAGAGSETGSAPVHFIAMELVAGETLATKIRHEKTELRALLGYLAQAAEGLAKAHAAGIIHRDLKPGNIMVTQDGFAKVLDFGLAKLTERSVGENELTATLTQREAKTGEGVVMGTTGYMSPEQVQGKPVDQRSDIFSFGSILYEAATRRNPFEAETGAERMAKILREKPAPIEELNPEAPAELRRLIRRCLAKDPNQRLDSMKALAIELREITEDYDALSASANSGSGASAATPTTMGARRFMGPGVLIVGGLVGLVGIALAFWALRRDRIAVPEASTPTVKITSLTTRGDVSDAALSADGRYLAYVYGPPERISLRVRQIHADSDVEILPPQAKPISNLSFSPDGDHLYYTSDDPSDSTYNALYQIPSLGGVSRKRGQDVGSPITFDPVGKHVCFTRKLPDKKHEALTILDLDSSEEKTLGTIDTQSGQFLAAPVWSPDGTRIVVGELGISNASKGLEVSLASYLVKDSRRDAMDPGAGPIVSIVWLPDASLVFSALEIGSGAAQLWHLPYPNGHARRITGDQNTYFRLTASSNGSVIAALRGISIKNLWMADAGKDRRARQLTFASTAENTVTRYALTEKAAIIYRSGSALGGAFWRIDRDGSGQRSLLPAGVYGFNFYSVPGGTVLFNRFEEKTLAPHLWSGNADGENAHRLVPAGLGEVLRGVSPDGRTAIYGPTEHLDELWSVSTSGGKPVQLGRSFESSGGSVQFSPDGTRLAFNALEDVEGHVQRTWEVIPAEGGEAVANVSVPLTYSNDLEWSPDGKSLTFLGRIEGVDNVFRQPLDGSRPQPITHFNEGQIVDHEWSPDGKRLLVERRTGQSEDLFTTAPDGSNPSQIAHFDTGKIYSVDWMPDGKDIVFIYGQESNDAVLISGFR